MRQYQVIHDELIPHTLVRERKGYPEHYIITKMARKGEGRYTATLIENARDTPSVQTLASSDLNDDF